MRGPISHAAGDGARVAVGALVAAVANVGVVVADNTLHTVLVFEF